MPPYDSPAMKSGAFLNSGNTVRNCWMKFRRFAPTYNNPDILNYFIYNNILYKYIKDASPAAFTD